jgi:L-threonylcarbamoyladenylate synthase
LETIIGTDLAYAARLLRAGELVAIPTETVYGLGGNALDTRAVAHIFAVKDRPSFDPLIIHLPGLEAVDDYVSAFPARLRELGERFWPGPLTLLLPRRSVVPDLVTSGLPRVAVRVPAHPLTRQLLTRLDFPLAAPSANPFGYISPTRPRHVLDQLGGKIPYILDGGPCTVGVESTIVAEEDGEVVILRKGGLPIEAIEEVTGPVRVQPYGSSQPTAPGMLKSHYAPRAPVFLAGNRAELESQHGPGLGALVYRHWLPQLPQEHQRRLSPQGDPEEAARHLFACLRELDQLGLQAIWAELLPETGLGRAINDRLRRAAAR